MAAKIVLFGQAPFGARVLEGLIEAGHEIMAVCVPPDREGRAVDPLKEQALASKLRIVQRRSYKAQDAAGEVDARSADLGVLAFVTQIIPVEILDAPRLKSVCFHPSLLPAYRGGSAIPWQLINGETRGGLTLFRPDEGVDAGPIYLKREIEIGPDDSAGSYYYAKVFEAGVAATLECVEGVLGDKLEGKVQDEAIATHDPLCRDQHAAIDWSRPTQELHDLIRGCDPAPGAHTRWNDVTVRLYGSRRTGRRSDGAPGTVVALDEQGIEVATRDGSLRFAKMAVDGRKVPAAEAAAAAGIEPGVRLVRRVDGLGGPRRGPKG